MMAQKSKQPVLFLDRDGTLNVDKSYINDLAMLELIPGIDTALKRAKDAGFSLSVITNQAGIAKGLTPPDMPKKIHAYIEKQTGVVFDDLRVCPHRPEDKCQCRKPGIANLIASAEMLNADLSASWYVGDHLRDLEMAKRAGLRSVLVLTGHGATTLNELKELESKGESVPTPAFVADDLLDAVEFILKTR